METVAEGGQKGGQVSVYRVFPGDDLTNVAFLFVFCPRPKYDILYHDATVSLRVGIDGRMHEELAAEQVVRGLDPSLPAKNHRVAILAADHPESLPGSGRLASAREYRHHRHAVPRPQSDGV